MKTFIFLCQITAVLALTANAASASGGDKNRGHWSKHHKHHGEHYYPPAQGYYPQPYQNYRDPRSHQGLAGGVVGSVLGYELGNGNPLATGVGAAAGSLLGNELPGRR